MTNPLDDEPGTGRLIGYARVSTNEQRVEMQINALLKAGVARENIYSESASGVKKNRPALAEALRHLESGDTLVVWKLDRIARSMLGLLKLLERLEAEGVRFRSITERFETDTLAGRFMVHILGALSEFERGLIRQRSQAGVDNAKAEGVQFGAKQRVSDETIAEAWRRVHEGGGTRVAVAKDIGITTQHMARRFKKYEKKVADELSAAAPVKKKPAAKRRTTRT